MPQYEVRKRGKRHSPALKKCKLLNCKLLKRRHDRHDATPCSTCGSQLQQPAVSCPISHLQHSQWPHATLLQPLTARPYSKGCPLERAVAPNRDMCPLLHVALATEVWNTVQFSVATSLSPHHAWKFNTLNKTAAATLKT